MPSSSQSQRALSSQLSVSTATSTARGRKRAVSFTSTLRKLLPSNKTERGGTLRKHGYHDSESLEDVSLPSSQSGPSLAPSINRHERSSERLVHWNTAVELSATSPSMTNTSSPGSRSLQLYLERREKRRQRRSLKESGDYLGVQGINPTTGEMDVLTPSSSSAATTSSSLLSKREAYERARCALRAEKMRKWEMDKDALKRERRRKSSDEFAREGKAEAGGVSGDSGKAVQYWDWSDGADVSCWFLDGVRFFHERGELCHSAKTSTCTSESSRF